MATGFTQRFKGKIQANRIDVGIEGIRQYAIQSSAALATSTNFLQNAGLSVLVTSSGTPVFTLEAPVQGIEKTIAISTQSSGAIIASTAATFDGTNPVIKFMSTVGTLAGVSLNLIGLSTSRWAIRGMFPPSTTVWLLAATT